MGKTPSIPMTVAARVLGLLSFCASTAVGVAAESQPRSLVVEMGPPSLIRASTTTYLYSWDEFAVVCLPADCEPVRSLPADLRLDALFGVVRIAGVERVIAFEFGGDAPVVRLDRLGDGDLSNDTPVVMSPLPGGKYRVESDSLESPFAIEILPGDDPGTWREQALIGANCKYD